MQNKKTKKGAAPPGRDGIADKLVKVKEEVRQSLKIQAAQRGLSIGEMLEQDYVKK